MTRHHPRKKGEPLEKKLRVVKERLKDLDAPIRKEGPRGGGSYNVPTYMPSSGVSGVG